MSSLYLWGPVLSQFTIKFLCQVADWKYTYSVSTCSATALVKEFTLELDFKFLVTKWLNFEVLHEYSGFGIWGVRSHAHASAHALNIGDGQKKLFLIKKASRCAADRTLKQQVFYLSLSIKHKDVTRKSCVFVYYFIGSVVKMVLSEAAAWGVL